MSIMVLYMVLFATLMTIAVPVQSYGALIGMMELNLITLYRICKTIVCQTKGDLSRRNNKYRQHKHRTLACKLSSPPISEPRLVTYIPVQSQRGARGLSRV